MVNDADYAWLNQWKWSACWNRHTDSFYAMRVDRKDGTIRMSRLILGLKRGDPRKGEHRDGDTLNNCRSNLRPATNSENLRNRGPQRNNSSGFKGVCKCKDAWRARIKIHGKIVSLGCFPTPEAAHSAYATAAPKYHGDFHRVA